MNKYPPKLQAYFDWATVACVINLYVPSFHREEVKDKIINLVIDMKEMKKDEIKEFIETIKR